MSGKLRPRLDSPRPALAGSLTSLLLRSLPVPSSVGAARRSPEPVRGSLWPPLIHSGFPMTQQERGGLTSQLTFFLFRKRRPSSPRRRSHRHSHGSAPARRLWRSPRPSPAAGGSPAGSAVPSEFLLLLGQVTREERKAELPGALGRSSPIACRPAFHPTAVFLRDPPACPAPRVSSSPVPKDTAE